MKTKTKSRFPDYKLDDSQKTTVKKITHINGILDIARMILKDINLLRKRRGEPKMKMTCGKAKKRSRDDDNYKSFIRRKFEEGTDEEGTAKEKMERYAEDWQRKKKERKKELKEGRRKTKNAKRKVG